MNNISEKENIDIKSLTLPKLKEMLKDLGEQNFRAGQIYSWLHKQRVDSFSGMTNLSSALREKLSENCEIKTLKVERVLASKLDGTKKYLLALDDGDCVEAVLMQYKHAYSLCISTQVGCKMGCKFCASTLAGFKRNLTASEMLEQIYLIEQDAGVKVGSLVLMGIGEPLDNFNNVVDFLNILSSPEGKNLSLRHVSLSTCGLVDKIYDLMELKLGITLSISLHATNDKDRSGIMPVNNSYNIEKLLKACKDYFNATGRRISFEYALIEGVNDTPEKAKELISLLKGMVCHVNLIPINSVKETNYIRSANSSVERFKKTLLEHNINATVRRELGSDIDAACGQLRLNSKKTNAK